MTRILSTTIAGAGASSIIGDALRSVVDWTDACIIILTSADPPDMERTVAACREVADGKLILARWDWRNDFGAARNYALDLAAEEGEAWVATLDADERIRIGDFDIRSFLASSKLGAYLCSPPDATYSKQRFIRVPCATRWLCRTHEAFPPHELGQDHLPQVTFDELDKTPEQLRAKFERDARILREDIEHNPRDPRLHYYLGASLHGLGDAAGAIEAFRSCAKLNGWPEESAWACYRAAELLCAAGRYAECVDACSAGLARHAGIAELCWLAGVASYRGGKPDQAAYWAQLAKVHGANGDGRALKRRLAFRHPPALLDGPDDVLRHALAALGESSLASP